MIPLAAHFSSETIALIAVLSVAQYGLLIWAIVVLVRTDKARLTLPLVAWLLIMILVNGLGPIAFLAFGRRPKPVAPPPPRESGMSATRHAVDLLYGHRHV